MTPQAIAHYRITAKLGAGGMGEVYRATDTRLKREVAIKILPDTFAGDPERMARFQREAEVLASLNHPHIAHIYGVEEHALVMELVEGESPKGPLPFEDAWKIALQIAEALEYAHEKGIVHRDLKPANIKVTPEGVVKLLDFGLAKAYSGEEANSGGNLANSPTVTLGATVAGTVLGTAAYMAPEQAKGRRVDQRADIWAFGVVLFELLTGEQLFQGEDVADTLAHVLTQKPDLEKVPRQVRRLLGRCLQRDPKQRLRDIGEAKWLLDAQPAPEVPPPNPKPRVTVPWAIAAAVMALIAAVLAFVHFRERPPERPVVQFQIPEPSRNNSPNRAPVLSPDGRRLAIQLASEDGRSSIWIRDLDSLELRRLAGTEGALNTNSPFWSPDSRFIAFFGDGKLKKIDVSGGPAQTLCSVESPLAGAWNRDGTLFFARQGYGIWRVPQAGGTPVLILPQDAPSSPTSLSFLPDGNHFLYTLPSPMEEGTRVMLATADGKQRAALLDGNGGMFAPAATAVEQAHVLFLRGDTLMAQPFNEKNFTLAGEAFPVAEQVTYFSVSNNGSLTYRSGRIGGINGQLAWFDRTGKSLGLVGPADHYNDMALSPDGKRVAVTRQDSGNGDIWILDIERNVFTRLTFDAALDWDPVWSPDGQRVAFASRRDGGVDQIYWKHARGIGNEERGWKATGRQRPKGWSADGKFLLFNQAGVNQSSYNLWVVPADPGRPEADRKPTQYFASPYNITQGQFSPIAQGPQWIAYTSNESGQSQIYVQSFPAGDGKFQVSINGGVQPRWSRDGKELYYLSLDRKLMAVPVKIAPDFEYGAPKELFQTYTLGAGGFVYVFRYDVAADGRFLVLNGVDEGSNESPPFTVVLNWSEASKKR